MIYGVRFALYDVQCTVCIDHCLMLYNAHLWCTVYIVHGALYIVHCRLHHPGIVLRNRRRCHPCDGMVDFACLENHRILYMPLLLQSSPRSFVHLLHPPTTLHLLLSIYYHSSTTLHLLPCTYFPAPTTCTYFPAHTTLHLLPCTYYPAPTTLHILPCTYFPAPTSLHQLPCTYYLALTSSRVSIASPVLAHNHVRIS